MILSGVHAGPQELSRFHREAEAVAKLAHPNIVRLYEYGECRGSPYFSMEFVEGGNLAEKLRAAPQSARSAARFIEMLAGAVHHAHQHQLLHRDLKPANILLQRRSETPLSKCEQESSCAAGDLGFRISEWEPRVTDFGLAKQLDGNSRPTKTGAILGTPSYMAPEQAEGRGEAIGPATDVYALGAILYELLTGRPPFLGDTPLETLRQVISEEPVSITRLQARVPRDLETICSKCLRKEPAQRYATSAALGEDLRRFLASEPILARPVPFWARGLKWVARHPTAAGLIVVGGLALAGFGIGGLYVGRLEHRRAVEADALRKDAEQSFRQLLASLTAERGAIYRELHPRSGMLPVCKELLTDIAKHHRQLLDQRGDDSVLRRDLGDTYQQLGIVISEIGNLDEALKHLQQSMALHQRLVDENLADAETQIKLGAAYFYIGLLKEKVGELSLALGFEGKALEIWEKLQGTDAVGLASSRNVALCHWAMGNVYLARHDLALARTHHDKAFATADQDPDSDNLREHLAYSYDSLGQLQLLEHQLDKALVSLDKAAVLRKKLADLNSHHIWWQYDLARTRLHQSAVYQALGRRDEALGLLKEACTALEELLDANHCVSDFQSHLAEVLLRIGSVRREMRQYDEGLRGLEKARDICLGLLKSNPNVTQSQVLLAESYAEIGRYEKARGHHTAALRNFEMQNAYGKSSRRLILTFPGFRAVWPPFTTNWTNFPCLENHPDEARQPASVP
jgi:tetratricopeptide (TPR) repeat protein